MCGVEENVVDQGICAIPARRRFDHAAFTPQALNCLEKVNLYSESSGLDWFVSMSVERRLFPIRPPGDVGTFSSDGMQMGLPAPAKDELPAVAGNLSYACVRAFGSRPSYIVSTSKLRA